MGIDSIILNLAILVSFWLRIGNEAYQEIIDCIWLFPSITIFGIPIFIFTGQYRALTKHLRSNSLYKIIGRNLLIIFTLCLVGVMGQFKMPPRSSWILIWIILSVLIGGLRFILRDFLLKNSQILNKKNLKKENIVVYGAGSAGSKIALSIKDSSNILFFVDDSPNLIGRTLDGITIKSPQEIENHKSRIDKILIAMPSISNQRRKIIIKNLKKFNFHIYTIPSIEDLISRDFEMNNGETIPIEKILGREKVNLEKLLSGKSFNNKTILVTGAGGSIGSELCNQILNLNPSKLVLLELSEHALYKIQKNLTTKTNDKICIKSFLGNACDEKLLSQIFRQESIELVFHASAYKHVPIVEENPLVGIKNNVFSTLALCKVAREFNVKKVILISTDKAVRPTNIMGASKRLAEMIIQVFSEEIKKENSITKFSMVRFGNVLNSSGSVIPLFKEQINNGGPITVTHPEIIRYFMTIEEASQLVLQASEMTLGGDLFVLDMGNPVKITDLAKQMISLSGLQLKDQNNPNGDVEIKFTGLRPGEKLFEELLIDAECLETSHPLIFRAIEKSINPSKLWNKLNELKMKIDQQDLQSSLIILSELVPEWK